MTAAPEVALSRRERRRLEIRDRVLEVALSLFESKGYAATTVNEIVREADIAYGTFFNHFPSKLDVLRELSERALQDLFLNVEEIRRGPGTFAEHLVALFEVAAERAEEMGSPARELLSDMLTLVYPTTSVHDDRRIRLVFRRFVEDGLATGDIQGDVDLETLTEVLVGTWTAMMLSWVHFDDYPLRVRASANARFLARTLAA